MSMDPKVGDFAQADVLVEGKKIVAVGPNLHAGGAARDRRARPHRDARLHRHAPSPVRDGAAQLSRRRDAAATTGTPGGDINYFQYILLKFAPVYRPQDVYINELFGSLQPARRRRHDGARHLADPSLARSIRMPRSRASSIRAAAPPSAISRARAASPATSIRTMRVRIKKQWFSSDDQLVTMIMGGEVYLAGLRDRPGRSAASSACRSRRTSCRRSACARRSTLLAQGTGGDSGTRLGPDNLFVHMTGMSDMGGRRSRMPAPRSRSRCRSR